MSIEYLDGDLPVSTRRAISSHLDECYTCTENIDELRTVLRMCESAVRHPRPVDRFDELSDRLFRPVHRSLPIRRVYIADVLRRLMIAAMVILAISISPTALKFIRWTTTPAPNNDILSNGSGYICRRLVMMRPAIKWRRQTLRFEHEIYDEKPNL